jgi:protein-tyrosine phosphatase
MSGWPYGRARDGGIDEIPLARPPGRLWLCGKHAIGPDVEAALARAGATTAVCLVQPHEIAERYEDYVAWLRANAGGRAIWWPIHDLHAPDLPEALELLAVLDERLERGEGLLVHCGAGIGRAGTIAAAVLMRQGVSLHDALATVAAHRPMAGPEAGAQLELLEELAVLTNG